VTPPDLLCKHEIVSIPLIDQLPSCLTWKEMLAVLTVKFLDLPQQDTPVEHAFKDGHYYRTMKIPAGSLFIGRPHRVGHQVDLLEGQVFLIHEQSRQLRTAPDSMRTVPGYQTVFQALTDVVGRTVHPDTGERDVDKLEDGIFESLDSIKALGHEVMKRLPVLS
jgi:hypothetical protein